METVTTTEAADLLGLKSAASARTVLRRMGVEAVGRDVVTGEKLWPAEQIRNRPPTRQGNRTDLPRSKETR